MPTARNMGIGESHRVKAAKLKLSSLELPVEYGPGRPHGGFPFGLLLGDLRDTEQHSAWSEVR